MLTRVYEQHAGAIASYSLRRASAADAADVVADTFLVASRRHEEIPNEPDTLPWLYGVARRVLANQRRSRDRRTALHDRLRTEFVEFDAGRQRVEDADHYAEVARAMHDLSDDDAELLRLVAWEGLTPTELGTALDIEPSAVRQRLRRARQRLRENLATDAERNAAFARPSSTTSRPGAAWTGGGS